MSVVAFRCRAHVEPLGPEEPNPTHGIVLVRKGVFRRKRQGESLVADANQPFLQRRGAVPLLPPAAGSDECTILVVDGHRALEHFTNAFRREWGVPPSRFRDSHRAPIAGLRNIFQAPLQAGS